MPLLVVRSPWGLPLGARGLLPLPNALCDVGAGVVAGEPYTLPILKGCLKYQYRGVPWTGARGGRAGKKERTLFTPWLIPAPSRLRKGDVASKRRTHGAMPPIQGGAWVPFPLF